MQSHLKKEQIELLRKRYSQDARKALLTCISSQKRSKMYDIEPNPYMPNGERLLFEIG